MAGSAVGLNRKVVLTETTLGENLRRLRLINGADARFDATPVGYMIRCSDAVFAELDRDPLLLELVVREGIKVCDDRARMFLHTAAYKGGKVDQAFKNALKQHFEAGQPEVDAAVKRVLDHHATMNAQWSKYWKSTARDLAVSAVAVTTGIVGLAVAMPTGGLSIAFAVIGLARGIAGGVAKLTECWLKAEQIEDRLNANLRELMGKYGVTVDAYGVYSVKAGGPTTHAGRAHQIGATVANTLIQAPVAATMAVVEGDVARWRGKLASLYQMSHELAVELNKLLVQMDALSGSLSSSQQRKLAGLQERVAELLDGGVHKARFRGVLTVSSAYQRYQKGWERAGAFEQLLDTLKGVTDTEAGHRGVKIGAAFTAFFTNAAFTIHAYDGALMGAPNLMDAAAWDPSIGKQVGLVTGAGNDALGVVNDLREIFGAVRETPEEQAEYERVIAAFHQADMPVVTPRRSPPRPSPVTVASRPAPPPPVSSAPRAQGPAPGGSARVGGPRPMPPTPPPRSTMAPPLPPRPAPPPTPARSAAPQMARVAAPFRSR